MQSLARLPFARDFIMGIEKGTQMNTDERRCRRSLTVGYADKAVTEFSKQFNRGFYLLLVTGKRCNDCNR